MKPANHRLAERTLIQMARPSPVDVAVDLRVRQFSAEHGGLHG